MLNSYNLNSSSVAVALNQPSTGIIQKSNPGSRFIRCHQASKVAEWVFDKVPHLQEKDNYGYYKKYCDIIILQIMVFGKDELIIELIEVDKLSEDAK